MKKRMLSLLLCGAMCAGLLSGCGNASSAEVLNGYNWGEYIDTDLIDQFEEETGIKVIYNTFDSNENLYSRIQTTSYDVIIPSDYAISRFIDEDMLQPLNFDNIPNMKYIDEKYTHLDFDPEQKYSVPYTWGVVGIVYNTKYVDEADTGSWDLLWNPKYANRTAMFNTSRDALGIALMYLGCSLNTTDRDKLRQAADLIIAGKPVYQGIWMDQILEKLPAEEICCCALLQRRRGHDDRREPRSRVLRPEGGYEPVRGRDVHSEEREKRGGRGEVHQLHVLNRGGDGELGIHRLFQSARGRIRAARRGNQVRPAVFPGHERLSH